MSSDQQLEANGKENAHSEEKSQMKEDDVIASRSSVNHQAPVSQSSTKYPGDKDVSSNAPSRAGSVAGRNSIKTAYVHSTSTRASVTESVNNITSLNEPEPERNLASDEAGHETTHEEHQSSSVVNDVTSKPQTRQGSTVQKASGPASKSGTASGSPASKAASKPVSRAASAHLNRQASEKATEYQKASDVKDAAKTISRTQSLASKPQSRASSTVLKLSDLDNSHEDAGQEAHRNRSHDQTVMKSEGHEKAPSKPQSRAASVASRHSLAKENIHVVSLTESTKNLQPSNDPETSGASSTPHMSSDQQLEANGKENAQSAEKSQMKEDDMIASRSSVNHQAPVSQSSTKYPGDKDVSSNAQSRAGSVAGRNSIKTAHVHSTSTRASVTESVNNLISSNEPETERNLASDEAGHETTHEEHHSTSVIHDITSKPQTRQGSTVQKASGPVSKSGTASGSPASKAASKPVSRAASAHLNRQGSEKATEDQQVSDVKDAAKTISRTQSLASKPQSRAASTVLKASEHDKSHEDDKQEANYGEVHSKPQSRAPSVASRHSDAKKNTQAASVRASVTESAKNLQPSNELETSGASSTAYITSDQQLEANGKDIAHSEENSHIKESDVITSRTSMNHQSPDGQSETKSRGDQVDNSDAQSRAASVASRNPIGPAHVNSTSTRVSVAKSSNNLKDAEHEAHGNETTSSRGSLGHRLHKENVSKPDDHTGITSKPQSRTGSIASTRSNAKEDTIDASVRASVTGSAQNLQSSKEPAEPSGAESTAEIQSEEPQASFKDTVHSEGKAHLKDHDALGSRESVVHGAHNEQRGIQTGINKEAGSKPQSRAQSVASRNSLGTSHVHSASTRPSVANSVKKPLSSNELATERQLIDDEVAHEKTREEHQSTPRGQSVTSKSPSRPGSTVQKAHESESKAGTASGSPVSKAVSKPVSRTVSTHLARNDPQKVEDHRESVINNETENTMPRSQSLSSKLQSRAASIALRASAEDTRHEDAGHSEHEVQKKEAEEYESKRSLSQSYEQNVTKSESQKDFNSKPQSRAESVASRHSIAKENTQASSASRASSMAHIVSSQQQEENTKSNAHSEGKALVKEDIVLGSRTSLTHGEPQTNSVAKSDIEKEVSPNPQSRAASVASRNLSGNAITNPTSTRSSVANSVNHLPSSNEPTTENQLPYDDSSHEKMHERHQSSSRAHSVTSQPQTRPGSVAQKASGPLSKSGTASGSPASKAASKTVSRTASAHLDRQASQNFEATNDQHASAIKDDTAKVSARTQSLSSKPQSRAASTALLKTSGQDSNQEDALHSEHELRPKDIEPSANSTSLSHESPLEQGVSEVKSLKENVSKPHSRASSVLSRQSNAKENIQAASLRGSVIGSVKNLPSSKELLPSSRVQSATHMEHDQQRESISKEFTHSDDKEDFKADNVLGSRGSVNHRESPEQRVTKSESKKEVGSNAQSRATSVASRSSPGNAHTNPASTSVSVANSVNHLPSSNEPMTESTLVSEESDREKVHAQHQSSSRSQSVTHRVQTRPSSAVQKPSVAASKSGTATGSPTSKVASKQVSRTASAQMVEETSKKVEAGTSQVPSDINNETVKGISRTQSLSSKSQSRAGSTVLKAYTQDSNQEAAGHSEHETSDGSTSLGQEPTKTVTKSESKRDLTSKPQSRAASVASRQSNAKEGIKGASLRGSVTGSAKNIELSKEPQHTSRAASTAHIATDQQNEANGKKAPHSEDNVHVKDDNVMGSRPSLNHGTSHRQSVAKLDSEKVNSSAQSRSGSVVSRKTLGTADVNSTSTRASVAKSLNNPPSSNELEAARNLTSDEVGPEKTHEERHSTSVVYKVTSKPQTRQGSTVQKASGPVSKSGTASGSPASKAASKPVSRAASAHLNRQGSEKATEDQQASDVKDAAKTISRTQSLASKPQSRAASTVLKASEHDKSNEDDKQEANYREVHSKPQSRVASVASRHSDAKENTQAASVRPSVTESVKNLHHSKEIEETSAAHTASDQQ
ncbi:hypothetical protein HDU67_009724 [Dinochytrium kinnereticum]|nr:hypothetical protein HDU67_009724 [Dinochytrium kinnereticum]